MKESRLQRRANDRGLFIKRRDKVRPVVYKKIIRQIVFPSEDAKIQYLKRKTTKK
jgi:hypothetical protein